LSDFNPLKQVEPFLNSIGCYEIQINKKSIIAQPGFSEVLLADSGQSYLSKTVLEGGGKPQKT